MSDVQIKNKYVPDYIVSPGEVLDDYLEYAGLTQASLAERTGLSKKTINEIIKAKAAVTAETALKFERTLGRPAHFWSNLERQYQEDKTRLADKIEMKTHLRWLNIIPVKDMVKHGWLEKFKDKTQQLDAVLRFFAVVSPVEWETIWGRELPLAFRKTSNSKNTSGVQSAWLRRGEILAQNLQCAPYNKQKFQNALDEIRRLTIIKDPAVFKPQFEALCAAAGVAVLFVPALPKLGIHGVTRWLHDKPVMQLSLYLKSNDQLWFTIFHEACHIIKHSRRELFLEGYGLNNETENEADVFARDRLIPSAALKQFLASGFQPTLPRIVQFAREIGIAPGIVVGRLQHDKLLPMNVGNHLKISYEYV